MAPLGFWSSILTIFALQLSHPFQPTQVLAQFVQGYEWQSVPNGLGGFTQEPFWRPTVNDIPRQVVDLTPEVVYIEYNCWYMKDICKNAQNWFSTPRGQVRRPQTMFGYDLSTGRGKRNGKRRAKSCPTGKNTGWKNTHTCPETNQDIVMRHDGPWPYKSLEPGTADNQIQNRRNAQGVVTEYSKVRYSCDEFPPASWIEGGSGSPAPEAYAMDAETRCAAMRCGRGANGVSIKAEQDWQGTAHGRLRQELIRVTERRQQQQNQFSFFNKQDGIILFYWRSSNFMNGIAAKVYTYVDQSLTTLEKNPIEVSQAKRSVNETARKLEFMEWADTVSIEDLLASSNGKVTEHVILANDSYSAMPLPEAMGMPGMGMSSYLGSDMEEAWDDDEGSSGQWESSSPPTARRSETSEAYEKLTNMSDPIITPLIKNATDEELEKARKIVEDALNKSSVLNEARLANPLRNKYSLKPDTVVGSSSLSERRGIDQFTDEKSLPPPLLKITDEIADAAALVSESESVEIGSNVTRRQVQVAASGTFWMEHLDRKGTVPWGDDPSYPVRISALFRNVLNYGAVGDGVTDDTKAIKRAMNEPKRCGEKCNGSTTKNAIVYFPPGTYRVSSSIPMPFGTQIIGDANAWPTIQASRTFIGLGVLSTDEYTAGGTGADGLDQQWYINTANFYRQIRNIRIDITQTRSAQQVAGIHYQVAQATSLQNVELIAATGTKQRGIFAENGSGGVISDVTFRGGAFGLYGGNQQFTAQRLTFDGCSTGVQVIWDWGWVWKSITMSNVDVGFRLLPEETAPAKRQTVPGAGGQGNIGSASFIDSTFRNVGTAVLIAPPSEKPGSGSTGVIVENVVFEGVSKPVADSAGKTLLDASGRVDHWALGPVYSDGGARDFSMGGKIGNYRRQQGLLDSEGKYFEMAKPQYENRAVGDFLHVKDFGAKGDGTTDDTSAFQSALWASQGNILFVDAGSYILTSTITIPMGSKIVGETWSQLVASGPYFEDATKPKVMIKVGNEGDVGDIEMQDLIFTNRGPTAGLILVEWNIRAANPGSAALWDCHVRIGGATGTELTPSECPALTSGVAEGCNAASLMMHITPKASGYFENMWLWVADHMIDDPDLQDANNTMVQNSVYVARGLLIESVEPTWLYGTSSEHAVFYQYNFHNARNIFAGMIQTESPYYQPTPPPPAPFKTAVGVFPGDPEYACKAGDEFSGCDESWAVIIRGSGNIFIAGAGIYSWFSTYTQDCIDQHACQKVLVLLEENYANVRIQHLITIGAKYMAVMDGVGISAEDYLNVETHPRWSQLSVLDVSGNGTLSDMIWIDPKIWQMEQPSFTCLPPCVVKLPPWTGATSVVDYPRITVTDGSWSTTITRAPLTISNLIFEAVTLEAASGSKLRQRQGFQEFWPTPATRPSWPPVTYIAKNGLAATTAPSVPFPTPPSSIGPGAAAPPKGSWPKRAVQPIAGFINQPVVQPCFFWDPFEGCKDLWDIGEMPDPEDPYDERGPEDDVICPEEEGEEETTTSTTQKTTSTTSKEPTSTSESEPEPTESPYEEADPLKNERKCYDGGRKASHAQLDNAVKSFCNSLGKPGTVFKDSTFKKSLLEPSNGGGGPRLEMVLQFELFEGCQWNWNFDECARYLHVPVDSCNCDGSDGKQGGSVKNNCMNWRLDPNSKW